MKILESFNDENGKLSSKKITAFWFVVLTTNIVWSVLGITYYSLKDSVVLKEGTFRVIDVGITAMLYLISATLLIYGVAGFQQVLTSKIMNPPPPTENKNIIQNPKIENVNIGENSNNNSNG